MTGGDSASTAARRYMASPTPSAICRGPNGGLDDPGWFNSQMDVWTSDAHPWDQMNPALPKFEKYPK